MVALVRPMRPGWFINDQRIRVEQSMILNDNQTSKGLRCVLEERNQWDKTIGVKGARELLSQQPNFLEQREWLQETVKNAGFIIDYYPKYHCEFNYIEMFWGAAKAWSRLGCTFNFNYLIALVPNALESVSLTKIRKFARKSYRYMDAYRVKARMEIL